MTAKLVTLFDSIIWDRMRKGLKNNWVPFNSLPSPPGKGGLGWNGVFTHSPLTPPSHREGGEWRRLSSPIKEARESETMNSKPPVYNERLKNLARSLRKNMTLAERILWARLRKKQINGLQFYRQRPLGPYIVDFYCPAAKLIIEIDGGGHYFPNHVEYDRERDKYFSEHGFKVLRFNNLEVMKNLDSVLEVIYRHTSKALTSRAGKSSLKGEDYE